MNTPVFLHRTDSVTMQAPRLGPPLVVATLGLGLAAAFGIMTSYALTSAYPAWLRSVPFLPLEAATFRTLTVIVGGFNGVIGVLVAVGYLSRAWSILGHRMGIHPVVHSQGPCRLVQEEPSIWGLQLCLTGGEDPGSTWSLTTQRLAGPECDIFFRLDEASAGAISRFFNPGEILTLRWLDLPLSAGGPTLLEVRTPAREVSVLDHPDDLQDNGTDRQPEARAA
jgi:hypothetical protein